MVLLKRSTQSTVADPFSMKAARILRGVPLSEAVNGSFVYIGLRQPLVEGELFYVVELNQRQKATAFRSEILSVSAITSQPLRDLSFARAALEIQVIQSQRFRAGAKLLTDATAIKRMLGCFHKKGYGVNLKL